MGAMPSEAATNLVEAVAAACGIDEGIWVGHVEVIFSQLGRDRFELLSSPKNRM